MVGGGPDLAQLNGLREAFLGKDAGNPARTLEEWRVMAMERQRGDEGLERFMQKLDPERHGRSPQYQEDQTLG